MADPLLPLEMSIVQGTLAKNYFPYLCNVEKLKLNLLSPYILMLLDIGKYNTEIGNTFFRQEVIT